MHMTSHPGSGFQSNTPSVPLAFLNVLIQELKQSKAWVQAKAPPHHFWGPPGQDCCLGHAVKQQKSSAATYTGAHWDAGLTRAGTKTRSRCGRRCSAHGTSTQPLGYLCTNNGKFYDWLPHCFLFHGGAGNGSGRWEQIWGTTAGKVSLRGTRGRAFPAGLTVFSVTSPVHLKA